MANILSHHVRLSVEGIDRMYLNIYVPAAAERAGRGAVLPAPPRPPGQRPAAALKSPLSRGFVAQLERFVSDGLEVIAKPNDRQPETAAA